MVAPMITARVASSRSGTAALRNNALHHRAPSALRAQSTSSNNKSRITTATLAAKDSASQRAQRDGARYATAAAAVTAVALTTWYATSSPVHNEAAAPSVATTDDITPTTMSQQDQMRQRAHLQGVYAWGSNRYNVVAPDAPQVTLVRSPRSIPFFDGVALRDISLRRSTVLRWMQTAMCTSGALASLIPQCAK